MRLTPYLGYPHNHQMYLLVVTTKAVATIHRAATTSFALHLLRQRLLQLSKLGLPVLIHSVILALGLALLALLALLSLGRCKLSDVEASRSCPLLSLLYILVIRLVVGICLLFWLRSTRGEGSRDLSLLVLLALIHGVDGSAYKTHPVNSAGWNHRTTTQDSTRA